MGFRRGAEEMERDQAFSLYTIDLVNRGSWGFVVPSGAIRILEQRDIVCNGFHRVSSGFIE